jgi:hypothetical protein
MRYNSHFLKDKIIVKLSILIAIEVLLVASSFGISTYIQSQSTAIGNTINIAGKNRYRTSHEKYYCLDCLATFLTCAKDRSIIDKPCEMRDYM